MNDNPFLKYKEQPQENPFAKYKPNVSGALAEGALGSITGTLGLPGDIYQATVGRGIEAVTGKPAPEGAFTSKALRGYVQDLAPQLGLPEGREPVGALEKTAQGAGMAVGAIPATLGLVNVVAKSKGALGQLAKNIQQQFTKSPIGATTAESVAGAGAGLGGAIAQENNQSELSGQLIGGTLAPALMALSPTNLAVQGGKMIARNAVPFTEAGGRVRAAERLERVSPDIEEAKAALSADYIAPLTPAQRTGQEGIMSIEAAVAAADPRLSRARQEGIEQSRSILEKELMGGGDARSAIDFISSRKQALLNKVEQSAKQAESSALSKIEALKPSERASQSSIIARQELEKALSQAKQAENELWSNIPSVGVGTSITRSRFADILQNTPRAQVDDIPVDAKRLLDNQSPDKFRSIESAKELQGLRSKMLEEQRAARAAGNYNKARIAGDVADAILEDLGATANAQNNPAGQALREALDFSKQVRERFSQGALGRTLMPEKTGADKVAPELTLQTLLGTGNVRGDVGVQQLLSAADTPELRQSVQDYMLDRLSQSAIRDGKINQTQAQKFLEQNKEILDKFPTVRQSVTQAIQSQAQATRIGQRAQSVEKSLTNNQKSAIARLTNAPIFEEIDTVFKSKDPIKSAKIIRNAASKDPEAFEGVRNAAMEYLTRKATINGKLSGKALSKQLDDMRTRKTLVEIVGEDGVDRATRIASELSILDVAEGVTPAQKIIDDRVNAIINMVGTTVGARVGAKFGAGASGASLKTASAFSRQAQERLQGLTADKAEAILIRAMNDPELFEALIKKNISTPKAAAEAGGKLNAWLTGVGLEYIGDEE